jgi:hypothetical protein
VFFFTPKARCRSPPWNLRHELLTQKRHGICSSKRTVPSSTLLKAYLCSSIVAAFASHLPFPASLLSLRTKIRTLKDRVLRHTASFSRTVDRTFGVRFFCLGPYSTLLTSLLGTYVRNRIQFFLAIEYQCWVAGSLVLWRTPGSGSKKLN